MALWVVALAGCGSKGAPGSDAGRDAPDARDSTTTGTEAGAGDNEGDADGEFAAKAKLTPGTRLS